MRIKKRLHQDKEEEQNGVLIRTHTTSIVAHKQQEYQSCRGAPWGARVQSITLGSPSQGTCTGKKSPIFENQWGLCPRELEGCGKPRLCFWRARAQTHSKFQCRGSSLKSTWVMRFIDWFWGMCQSGRNLLELSPGTEVLKGNMFLNSPST